VQSPSPDVSKIPPHELRGVTVVLVTCSYEDKEFVRIGYYVNNDYHTQEMYVPPPCRLPGAHLRGGAVELSPDSARPTLASDAP